MKKKEKSIFSSTLKLTFLVLLIKILGLVKKSSIAAVCGATAETDAFFIASDVITSLCTVVFSSISVSFLSMYTKRYINEGKDSSNNLTNAVLRVFIPVSILITLIFTFFSNDLARLLAPTYDSRRLYDLSLYIKIMSIMFIFMSYYLILNAVLESHKIFLPGKMQALFQNLSIIIATLLFYRWFGMTALLWSFIVAGILQCVQITWSSRKVFAFKKHIFSERKSIQALISLSLPLILGNAVYEINDIVDKRIASGLDNGGVSVLSYGASINEIVTSLIVTSLSTVLYSHYATWIAEGKIREIGNNLQRSLMYLLVIIMPITVICFDSGSSIVEILYSRGNFDTLALNRTTGVVIGYAVGFFFQAARSVIVKIYYAFQDTKTPMLNGIFSVIVNVVLSVVLSKLIGVTGIALATSLSMLLVTVLLYPGIKKYIPGFSFKPFYTDMIKVFIITGITYILLFLLNRFFGGGVFIKFVVNSSLALGAYIVLLLLFNVYDFRKLFERILPKKLKR